MVFNVYLLVYESIHMDKALSPINNDLIDTNEYKKFATNNGYQLTNLAPPARCPVCKGDMRIRAGKLKDNEHFYHIIRNGVCDTKEPAARPYLALSPQNIDPKAVISIVRPIVNTSKYNLKKQIRPHIFV